MQDLKEKMNFIIEIDKLKSIFRQTLISDASRFENDAEHSWHMCMLAIVLEDYAPKNIDILKCIKMMLIHDLVEIYAGDTYLYDDKGYESKEKKELEAADKLYSMIGEKGIELKNLWLEFEMNKSNEAIFANTLDRVQPIILNYITKGQMWREHNVKKEQVINKVKKAMDKGNPIIMDYILDIIEESHQLGYLK